MGHATIARLKDLKMPDLVTI